MRLTGPGKMAFSHCVILLVTLTLVKGIPLIPSNGVRRPQRVAHQEPIAGGASCCRNANGIGHSARGLFVCYIYNQRVRRQHASAVRRVEATVTGRDGEEQQHHSMIDAYVRAAGLKVVGSRQRGSSATNQSQSDSGANLTPARRPAPRAADSSPAALRVGALQVLKDHHHTLYEMTSTASAPLCASLFLPVSQRPEQTADGDQAAEDGGIRLRFWVTAKWHKRLAPNPRPVRYAWECAIHVENSNALSTQHWFAVNMKEFFNKTFSTTALPESAPLFLPRTAEPTMDRLHVLIHSSAPSNSTQDGVTTEIIQMDESGSPCARLVTLPCLDARRENISWDPFLAIANGPSDNGPVVQRYRSNKRKEPGLLRIIPRPRPRLPPRPTSRRIPLPRLRSS